MSYQHHVVDNGDRFFFLVMKSASIISFVGKLHGQLEKRETVNFL